MNRKEAREKGMKRFNTGRLCARGHKSDRFTANGVCCECSGSSPVHMESRLSASKEYVMSASIIMVIPVMESDAVAAMDAIRSLGTSSFPGTSPSWYWGNWSYLRTLGKGMAHIKVRVPIQHAEIIRAIAANPFPGVWKL